MAVVVHHAEIAGAEAALLVEGACSSVGRCSP